MERSKVVILRIPEHRFNTRARRGGAPSSLGSRRIVQLRAVLGCSAGAALSRARYARFQ
jgi:hypothetical protein